MVKDISRFGKLSIVDTESCSGDDWRSVKKGDGCILLTGHERSDVTSSHEAGHIMTDLIRSQHLSSCGEFSLNTA